MTRMTPCGAGPLVLLLLTSMLIPSPDVAIAQRASGVARLPKVPILGEPVGLDITFAEFDRRKSYGLGHFIASRDFRGRRNASLADALRNRVPNLLFMPLPGGGTAVASRRAIVASVAGSGWCTRSDAYCVPLQLACYMRVWVDHERVYTYRTPGPGVFPPPNMEDIPFSQIVGVEVYDGEVGTGAAETPVQFHTPGSSCGTMVIWTRKGWAG